MSLTDVIGASFAANVIQLASPGSGDGSEAAKEAPMTSVSELEMASICLSFK